MQYDYNSGGLRIDVAGLVTAKAKKEQIDAEKRRVLQIAERDKKYQETYSKYRQTGDSKLLRDLMGLDAERTKQITDMDAQFNDQEQQSIADTVQEAKFHADQGDITSARTTFLDRLATLSEFGSSTVMSAPLAKAAQDMDDLDFIKVLDQSYGVGVGKGLIKEPPAEELEYLRSAFDDKGREYAMLMRPDGSILQRYTLDTRQAQEEHEKRTRANAGDVPDIGKDLSKMRVDLIQESRGLRSRASSAANLYNQYNEIMPDGAPAARGGLVGKLFDSVLGVVGEEDQLTFLRTQASELTAKQVVALLPKGPASDKDVALMQKAVPDPYANPKEFKKWLGAYKRVAEQSAIGAELHAEWIERTRGGIVATDSTNMRGIRVPKGMRFDQFRDKFAEKQEKERKEREKAERQFSNQEEQLGQELGVNNVPSPANTGGQPIRRSWNEL